MLTQTPPTHCTMHCKGMPYPSSYLKCVSQLMYNPCNLIFCFFCQQYVGESERAVRQCFQRARSSQPCVIFFDEIDALCPKRVNMDNGASRVVNQLLTEMDGMEARPGVFLMAATNRPDIGELIVPIQNRITSIR